MCGGVGFSRWYISRAWGTCWVSVLKLGPPTPPTQLAISEIKREWSKSKGVADERRRIATRDSHVTPKLLSPSCA